MSTDTKIFEVLTGMAISFFIIVGAFFLVLSIYRAYISDQENKPNWLRNPQLLTGVSALIFAIALIAFMASTLVSNSILKIVFLLIFFIFMIACIFFVFSALKLRRNRE